MPFGFVTTYPRSSVLSPKASANPDVGREKPMARNTFWAAISTDASVVSSAFIRPVAASGVHFNRAKRTPRTGALLHPSEIPWPPVPTGARSLLPETLRCVAPSPVSANFSAPRQFSAVSASGPPAQCVPRPDNGRHRCSHCPYLRRPTPARHNRGRKIIPTP